MLSSYPFPTYNLLIAGGRNFSDYQLLAMKAAAFIAEHCNGQTPVVISGHARGADSLGEQFAREYELPYDLFIANWDKYGRAAGPIRNREMAEVADGAVIFWDGESRGTRSMIALLHKFKVPFEVVRY